MYLKTLFIGFEALKIERRAKFIYESLKRLEVEIVNILREYSILGTHLKSASSKYEEIRRRIEGIQTRLSSFKTQELIEDEKLRLKMGARGRGMAQDYGVVEMVKKIDDLYTSLYQEKVLAE